MVPFGTDEIISRILPEYSDMLLRLACTRLGSAADAEDAVQETARMTDEKIELTEDQKTLLDAELQKLAEKISSRPRVTVTYFQPDKKKAGGAYICVTGQLKRIDDFEGALVLLGGDRILIEDILDIQITTS